jgi:arylsulfatase A-like enzyme
MRTCNSMNVLLTTIVATIMFAAFASAQQDAERPNVVLIVTDNQAAWTLGCYGNPDIRTPNIDRLAREGTLFPRCFSSNAVCSPTRATLLTGLIPSQHGVHSYLSAGHPQLGPRAYSTIAEFRSLPEILAEAGYVCGLSGKWHLGDSLHPQEGFAFWVTMPHGHTTTFYDAPVIEDGRQHKEPEYLTDFWTDHGIRFIEQNTDRPFFLLLTYNGPYGLGDVMSQPARNRHAAYYADKDLASFPREPMHPWLHGNKRNLNNPVAIRRYAAEISGVDDGVGRILDTLKENNLDDNTLVIFTADQGLAGGHGGFWGMGDHTRPRSARDPMIHTPLIFRHPGHIRANSRDGLLVSNYDFFPTVLDYLDLKEQTPTDPPLPGHSYAAVLRNNEVSAGKHWENVVYFEFEDTRAVRTLDWKYIRRFPDGPNELYNLKNEPGERENLVDQKAEAAIQKDLSEKLTSFFDRYADPRYDRTRGGASKADRNYFPN